MRKIRKFPFRSLLSDERSIDLPKGSRVLCAAFDNECECLCIFAEVDPDELGTEERTFFIVTDQEFNEKNYKYLNTLTVPIRGDVWHIYERFDGNYDL